MQGLERIMKTQERPNSCCPETCDIINIDYGYTLMRKSVPNQNKHNSHGTNQNNTDVSYNEKEQPTSAIYPGWWFGTFFIFPCIGKNNPK